MSSISYCSIYEKEFGRGETGKTNYNSLRGEILSNIQEFESEYHGFVTVDDTVMRAIERNGLLVGFKICGTWEPPEREFKLNHSDMDEMSVEEHIYFVLEDAFTLTDLYHAQDSEFVRVEIKQPKEDSPLDPLREMILRELHKP